jgi:hypothetical protein
VYEYFLRPQRPELPVGPEVAALTPDDFDLGRIQLRRPGPIPEAEARQAWEWMASWGVLSGRFDPAAQLANAMAEAALSRAAYGVHPPHYGHVNLPMCRREVRAPEQWQMIVAAIGGDASQRATPQGRRASRLSIWPGGRVQRRTGSEVDNFALRTRELVTLELGDVHCPNVMSLVGACCVPGQITAMDLASDNIARIQRWLETAAVRSAIRLKVGTVIDLPFPPDAFDAAWCSKTLQYLSDAELRVVALAELRRVIRPAGVLAV